jgi:hypothetical protein
MVEVTSAVCGPRPNAAAGGGDLVVIDVPTALLSMIS